MVVLNVKRGEEACFLFETTTAATMETVISDLSKVYHGRLRVERLCQAVEALAAHGIMKTPQMQGLTDEQVRELKYKDDTDKYYPSGGATVAPDAIGLRTGQAPSPQLQEVLRKTCAEARAAVHKDLIKRNIKLDAEVVQEQIDRLRGACMIVYARFQKQDRKGHICNRPCLF